MSCSTWMIRAEGGSLIQTFISKGIVAIGWEIGDLTEVPDRQEIANRLRAAYPDKSNVTLAIWTGFFHRFRFEIAIKDSVVTYDPSTRTYHIGSVTSDYIYDNAEGSEWPHIRKVTWSNQVSRDALVLSTKNSLGSTLTLFKLAEEAAHDLIAAAQGKPVDHDGPAIEEDGVSETQLLEETLNRSREFVKDRMAKLAWQQMQELVAGLLRAMGYKTRVSPQGSDRGRDIVASPDGFGLEQPRIVVEVKHRKNTTVQAHS